MDVNDCMLFEIVIIGELLLFEFDFDVIDVICVNVGDGQVIINVLGGNDVSYIIFVDGNEVVFNIIIGFLGLDMFIVIVWDVNFCEIFDIVIINELEVIELSFDV